MANLRKLLDLGAAERRLLIEAAALLAAIRLGLWVLPFQTLRRLLAKITAGTPASVHHPDRIAVQVMAAGRCWPGAHTCLSEALATQVLLGRYGHQALLRIGVRKDEQGGLSAHAWVENQGRVVIGDREL